MDCFCLHLHNYHAFLVNCLFSVASMEWKLSTVFISGSVQFSSVAQSTEPHEPHESHEPTESHEPQHARPPCPAPAPRVHPNPCPSSRWCHPAISSSVVPLSSCPQSFPASGSFPMSQLFASGWVGVIFGISPVSFHSLLFGVLLR